jgi:hypothetical protein
MQYDNIYNILTENVAKAKVRLANLADGSPSKLKSKRADEETVARIFKQKQDYETLVRQYQHDSKAKAREKDLEKQKIEK